MEKQLKKSMITSLVALGIISISGCEDQNYDNSYLSYQDQGMTTQEIKNIEERYIKQLSMEQLKEQLNKDNVELSEMLKNLQSKDPTIDSLYYSIDDSGNKILHVVRNDSFKQGDQPKQYESLGEVGTNDMMKMYDGYIPNVKTSETPNEMQATSGGSSFSDYAFPLVGGLTAGYLMSNIMSRGLSGTSQVTPIPPSVTKNITEKDKRERRNHGFYAYGMHSMNNSKSSISNGIKSGAIKSPAASLSTRSQGHFNSSKGSSSRSGSYGGKGG